MAMAATSLRRSLTSGPARRNDREALGMTRSEHAAKTRATSWGVAPFALASGAGNSAGGVQGYVGRPPAEATAGLRRSSRAVRRRLVGHCAGLIGGPDGFAPLEELAGLLGGVVGVSPYGHVRGLPPA